MTNDLEQRVDEVFYVVRTTTKTWLAEQGLGFKNDGTHDIKYRTYKSRNKKDAKKFLTFEEASQARDKFSLENVMHRNAIVEEFKNDK